MITSYCSIEVTHNILHVDSNTGSSESLRDDFLLTDDQSPDVFMFEMFSQGLCVQFVGTGPLYIITSGFSS